MHGHDNFEGEISRNTMQQIDLDMDHSKEDTIWRNCINDNVYLNPSSDIFSVKQSADDKTSYRTIWLSDSHLGLPGCGADMLLSFLLSVKCERLYLVGDIIDVWAMRKRLYWPKSHTEIIRAILDLANNGTQIIYLPGNHDEVMRQNIGTCIGNFIICDEAIHPTADGRYLLVLHGDQFDSVVQFSRPLAMMGSHAYRLLLKANRFINWIRRLFNKPYWSLARYLKHQIKNVVTYISDFEQAVAQRAVKNELDGVVCGHIHNAEIRVIDGIEYFNCGDWVESCTFLAEDFDGSIELVQWAEQVDQGCSIRKEVINSVV